MVTTKRLTLSNLLDKFQKIHGERYDYSLVDSYKNNKTKISIICKKHGEFYQITQNHLMGQGCKKCADDTQSKVMTIYNTESFIKKSSEIHNSKYSYPDEFVSTKIKIRIICPKHGEFYQRAGLHMCGQVCIKCKRESNITTDEFISRLKSIYYDTLDYSKLIYSNSKKKIKLRCLKHNYNFEQRASSALLYKGCIYCNQLSIGEEKIKNILDYNGIKYHREHKFDDCINIFPLRFDFYLTDLKICVEYDGIQHYKPVEFFGGECNYSKTKERDLIKDEYCRNNNIELIRIRYDDDIENNLNNLLINYYNK